MGRIIGLVTDFGQKGQHYVAAMKAVILKINPLVKIIDISHMITPYSIIEASYILKSTYTYFPHGSIFISVIDPGVGSSREIIALKTKSNYYFIGPDNGIFPNFLSAHEISDCRRIQNKDYFNHPISPTFHGRDIMAPVGAYIAKNEVFPLSDLGSTVEFNNLIKTPVIYELDLENSIITCSIQYIDSFGNGTTTIQVVDDRIEDLDTTLVEGAKIKLFIKEEKHEGIFTSHFSSVPINTLLFLAGSSGFLEISLNQGNASKKLGFKSGETISVQI